MSDGGDEIAGLRCNDGDSTAEPTWAESAELAESVFGADGA